ncbi:MAG: caspase family protein [Anaerolineales bacterium]|nr:caspase family protein [Anaerolineales bacterium]
MYELIPRVTIMAVGVDQYEDPAFRNLHGPLNDIDNLHSLLVENEKTALYQENQFIYLPNLTANQLRKEINDYVLGRSADKDILVFYFSGHGVPIGRNDFGFCTKDTKVFPNRGPLPLSTVKYSELLRSIELANIIPIVMIDACYSGIAAGPHFIKPIDAITTMRDRLHSRFASDFALLCACSDEQFTKDTPYGGVFSQHLFTIALDGLPREEWNNPLLSLQAIFSRLNRKILGEAYEERPRLFMGPTLPNFPFVINTQFSLRSYSLTNILVNVLRVLWNNGNERELDPDEILEFTNNRSSYGNHNKLSLSPWKLVETIPNSRTRKLTQRGKDFMQGKLTVPYKVIEDPTSGDYIRAETTHDVSIGDYL